MTQASVLRRGREEVQPERVRWELIRDQIRRLLADNPELTEHQLFNGMPCNVSYEDFRNALGELAREEMLVVTPDRERGHAFDLIKGRRE